MTSPEPKRPLISWQCWLVIVGITVLGIILMLLPVIGRPKPGVPHDWNCQSHLKQIGLAIAMYADMNQSRCPMDSANPTLLGSMQILSNCITSAKIFYCPQDQRKHAYAEVDFKKLTTDNISYSYVPNLIWQDTPDSILALDRIYTTSAGDHWPSNGNHKGAGGYVLFNNGQIAWYTELRSALKDRDGKRVVLSP